MDLKPPIRKCTGLTNMGNVIGFSVPKCDEAEGVGRRENNLMN